MNGPLKYIILNTGPGGSVTDITSRVQDVVRQSEVADGLCYLFAPHTQAGITISNGAPGHAVAGGEVRAANALTLLVVNRRLGLSRGQGVYFLESCGPQRRKVLVKVVDGGPPGDAAGVSDECSLKGGTNF